MGKEVDAVGASGSCDSQDLTEAASSCVRVLPFSNYSWSYSISGRVHSDIPLPSQGFLSHLRHWQRTMKQACITCLVVRHAIMKDEVRWGNRGSKGGHGSPLCWEDIWAKIEELKGWIQAILWGSSVLGRGKGKIKDLEAKGCLCYWRNNQEAGVAGTQWVRGGMLGGKIKETQWIAGKEGFILRSLLLAGRQLPSFLCGCVLLGRGARSGVLPLIRH